MSCDDEAFDREWDAYERRDRWAARGDRAGQPPGTLGRRKPWRAAANHAAMYRLQAAQARRDAAVALAKLIRDPDAPHAAYNARRCLHVAVEYSTIAAGLDLAAAGL